MLNRTAPIDDIDSDEDAEETEYVGRRVRREPHEICVLLRQLRQAARLSLKQMEDRYGVSSVVLGAYERGDREPPLRKIDAMLRIYGYRLQAVPIDASATRMPADMVTTLRGIADQLEESAVNDLPALS